MPVREESELTTPASASSARSCCISASAVLLFAAWGERHDSLLPDYPNSSHPDDCSLLVRGYSTSSSQLQSRNRNQDQRRRVGTEIHFHRKACGSAHREKRP